MFELVGPCLLFSLPCATKFAQLTLSPQEPPPPKLHPGCITKQTPGYVNMDQKQAGKPLDRRSYVNDAVIHSQREDSATNGESACSDGEVSSADPGLSKVPELDCREGCSVLSKGKEVQPVFRSFSAAAAPDGPGIPAPFEDLDPDKTKRAPMLSEYSLFSGFGIPLLCQVQDEVQTLCLRGPEFLIQQCSC